MGSIISPTCKIQGCTEDETLLHELIFCRRKRREEETTLEKMTGYRLKVVERGGTKLEDILARKNFWEGELCDRKKLPAMQNEDER
jgi:hypothetical protein